MNISPRGIILIVIAAIGVVLNFSAKALSEKTKFSELTLKIAALVIVLVSVSLLMIFGK